MSAKHEVAVPGQQPVESSGQISEQEGVVFVAFLSEEPRCRHVLETVEDLSEARGRGQFRSALPLGELLLEIGW